MTDNCVILVDAHVHIYDCFNLVEFFEASLENFESSLDQLDPKFPKQLVILLTESSRENYFSTLKQLAQKGQMLNEHWTIQKTQEECSLYLRKNDRQGIFLVAGRQIVTSENLEVLALLTSSRVQDGMSFEKTVDTVVEYGGLPAIPWGFGKWLGRRGKIVSQFLDQETRPPLFLGDNSGRPFFWKYSPIFEQAIKAGVKILPGTDPLPFPREVNRPGKFGFRLNGRLNSDKPAETLKNNLLNINDQPVTYGTLENPIRFIQNQMAMQVLKRRKDK